VAAAVSGGASHEIVYFGESYPSPSERERARFLHFACGSQETAQRSAGQPGTHADATYSSSGQIRGGETNGSRQDIDGCGPYRGTDRLNFIERPQSRGIHHIGTRGSEGLEASDGVVQVVDSMQKILRARRQREREGQRPRCRDGFRNALHSVGMCVNWMALVASGVFDGAADQTRVRREANGFGDNLGVVTKTILEIP